MIGFLVHCIYQFPVIRTNSMLGGCKRQFYSQALLLPLAGGRCEKTEQSLFALYNGCSRELPILEKAMITVGRRYNLEVVKSVHFGFYLDAKNLGEVLLPGKYAADDLAIGDSIDVFLYLDSEDRPVATTETPFAQVGEFAYLRVMATTRVGAFIDWGLEKDILVPFGEQHLPMVVGRSYLVYLYLDKASGRIVASSKIDKFLDDERPHHFKEKQAVKLIIANTTDLGFKAIINNSHWGVLYANDVHERLSFGQHKEGFIKRIRSDNKIDLTLKGGSGERSKHALLIEKRLNENDGFLPVHDKSDPAMIAELFGISKGAFKKALGILYKQKVITIEKGGIRLVQK